MHARPDSERGELRGGHAADEAELRDFMSGNLCRCAAYPQIVAAIKSVAGERL